MKIPQNKIDEIAASIDIVDVISGYTQLRKGGKNFMGRCPFHEERTPSFSVSQEKGVYHCFGCGKSGNVFTFLMELENISFFEAAKELAEKANIKLEFDNELYDEDRNKIEILYEINRSAARIFHEHLKARNGAYAVEYLNKRELSEEMIVKFGIGYSLREKDSLFQNLKVQYSVDDLLNSGLFVDLGRDEIRDRFRGRLMFPIISEAGKVIAFGGRRIYEESTDEAKYINSPETKIYNKSRTLYGLNFSKNAIKQKGFVILVEGYLDLISLFQYGIDNVVASSGTSLTNLHTKILTRYTDEVVILFDSDLAGQNASRRAIELILEANQKATVIELPLGDDPDTYIRKYGVDKFSQLLNNRTSIIEYIGNRYKASGKLGTPEGNTEFVREVIGLIAKIKDEIKRDFYIKDISQRFSIYESIIRKELENHLRTRSKGMVRETSVQIIDQNNEAVSNNNSDSYNHELELIWYLLEADPETKKYLIDNLEIDYITNDKILTIVSYIIDKIVKGQEITQRDLFNEINDKALLDTINAAIFNDQSDFIQKKENYFDEALKLVIKLKINFLQNEIDKNLLILQKNIDTPESRLLSKRNLTYKQEITGLAKKLKTK